MGHYAPGATGIPLTLEDYRELERQGKITRPLTGSGSIGASSGAQRAVAAEISATFTERPSIIPLRRDWGPRPRYAGGENGTPEKRARAARRATENARKEPA